MSDYHSTEDQLVLGSRLVKKYNEFFIKVGSFDSGVFKRSDITLNKIKRMTSAPKFITKFEQTLDNKPGVVLDVCNLTDLPA
jgi:hypothetical protein